MNEDRVRELFGQGFDCSQVVFAHFAEKLGLDKDTANKVAASFGGGMMCGETCGAVTGAHMVIGLKYGHYKSNDAEQKQLLVAKSAEFRKKLYEKYNTGICKELLGSDPSKPEDMQKLIQSGVFTTFCPKLVKDVIDIVETL